MRSRIAPVLFLVSSLIVTVAHGADAKAEPPVPVRTVAPDYPPDLRQRGVSGLVTINCSIDEQGNVVELAVQKSSDAAFEQPAIAAVKKWKFKPATKDGAPTSVKVTIPIKFVAES